MGKKKDNEKVIIEMLGNSAVDVTGSCISIKFMDKVYLIECGMVQGFTIDKCYTLNHQLTSSIKADKIEGIFALHLHCDHIGMIPAITKKNEFKGKVITTFETKELSKLMLLDSSFILNKEAELLSQKKNGKVHPLYRDSDVHNYYEVTEAYEKDVIHKLNEEVSFRFLKNSHCLGAVQLELFFRTPSNKVKKVVYTSDIGSTRLKHKPFVDEMEFSKTANVFICESTYGKKSRSYNKSDVLCERKDLQKEILSTIKNGGKVLIPTFSFGRTQEVLKDLYDMFKDNKEFNNVPVVIDSKLSVEITGCYQRILQGENLELIKEITSWKNVKMNKDIKGTLANLSSDKPCVVLSSQGFLEAGRSQLYAKNFLENKRDAILFVGYCPVNSIGGRIQNSETKSVKIGNKSYLKKCKIKAYRTYSSHAQHDDLVNYICQVNTERVILHHGSNEAKDELLESLGQEFERIGKTTKVIRSYKNLTVEL